MVSIVLVVWTIIDPPSKKPVYSLSNDIVTDMMGNSRTVVDIVYFCSSDSSVWDFIAIAWNGLLLLCATVLAVQTRAIQRDFNESQTLAFLIYSHFLFVVLRLVLLFISSRNTTSTSEATISGLRSLIFSADTAATILIYFMPKFLSKQQEQPGTMFAISGLSNQNQSGPVRGRPSCVWNRSSKNISTVVDTSQKQHPNMNDHHVSKVKDVNATELDVTESSAIQLSIESTSPFNLNSQNDVIQEEGEIDNMIFHNTNNINSENDSILMM
jgi:7 transmembrane sweet-taste receptor of 3 GCPR